MHGTVHHLCGAILVKNSWLSRKCSRCGVTTGVSLKPAIVLVAPSEALSMPTLHMFQLFSRRALRESIDAT